MTAFAIDFRRDRIVIAADSLMYLPDQTEVKPLGFVSKVLPLQHLRAALFSRGQQQITVTVYSHLLLMPQLRSVEDVAEALPALLRDITEKYCDAIGIEDCKAVSLLNLSLCGWSEQKGRMQLWEYYNGNGYLPLAAGDIPYALHACPQLPKEFAPAVKDGAVHENCIAVIKALGRSFAADPRYAGCRVGGEIVATEIARDGVSQRTIARLPNYEEDRHAGAAVFARLERGDIDVAEAVRDGLCRNDGEPGEQQPAAKANTTRQQRRAAERAARRASRRAA